MSSRSEQFQADSKQALSLCTQYKWPFSEFVLQGNTLSFNCFYDLKKYRKYSLCVSFDDYPQNSILTIHDKTETTRIIHKPIQVMLLKLRDELMINDEKDGAGFETGASYERSASNESGKSEYEECLSDVENDEEEYCILADNFDDEMEDDQDPEETEKINTQLAADMDYLRFLYGESSLSSRLLMSIGEIDVDLNIPVSFLYAETAEAWKLNLDEPLIVRLHLSSVNYLDQKDPPKVEVLQETVTETFGLGSQIRKILENFLRENWKKLSNKGLQSTSKSVSVPAELSSFLEEGDGVKNFDSEEAQASVCCVSDEDLAKLVEMGFSSEIGRNALIITRGNVQEALNLLLNNPESCTDFDMASQISKPMAAPQPFRQTSHPASSKKQKHKKPQYGRYKTISTSNTDPNISSTLSMVEDLTLMPSSTLIGKNAKVLPSLENGFLVQVFRYIRQRIPTLNEYCVVCDEPHIFQNGAMLKPTVCSRELCVFAFQTLGVMVDAADDIATGAEVVVLLMKMTMAAGKSSRKQVIFDPYPTVVDPDDSEVLALNPKKKDFATVQAVLDNFPSVDMMLQKRGCELKKDLDDRHRLAYPLLQWIIGSNRSHIVKLPPDRQIKCMKTPHQFLLLSSPPAKEQKFRDEKAKYGSTFAFHGSSIENWHSIIRQGLVVASGTNKQMNGAAYGKGIYLSPSVSVSSGYSRMGCGTYHPQHIQTNSRFVTSDSITCIALCEVITSPKLKMTNDIWVCSEDCHVCTRFFFVYEDGQVGDNAMHTQKERYKNEIIKAVSYHKNK